MPSVLSNPSGRRLLGGLIPFSLLLVWFMTTATGVMPEYLLPSPQSVLKMLVSFIAGGSGQQTDYTGTFLRHASASMLRVAGGFLLAAVVGIPAGILSGRSRRVSAFIDPFIQLIRSVPGISWLPLAMVWFGIGNSTTIFLISLAAFFPVYINTLHGARNVPLRWLQSAAMLGAGRWHTLVRVVLPGIMPSVEAGLRLALGVSWAYVVLGELTGVNQGLGAMIMDARVLGDVRLVIVGIICIAVMGRLSDLLLSGLMRRMPGHSPALAELKHPQGR